MAEFWLDPNGPKTCLASWEERRVRAVKIGELFGGGEESRRTSCLTGDEA